jgi:hypothetical protein
MPPLSPESLQPLPPRPLLVNESSTELQLEALSVRSKPRAQELSLLALPSNKYLAVIHSTLSSLVICGSSGMTCLGSQYPPLPR